MEGTASSGHASGEPRFEERPTEFIVRDGFVFAVAPLVLGGLAGLVGWTLLGALCLALTVFVACFFRNPPRFVPGDERTVVAPADGRVMQAGDFELPDGSKAKRVAIFLSVFNVHVNRMPVAGRVLAVERSGSGYRAAFRADADATNVRCDLQLETARGERVVVSQITGWIARRIVCHPLPGEWVERGARYGLIRFGSRTDVVLPASAELRVRRGEVVKGGSSVLAQLPREA